MIVENAGNSCDSVSGFLRKILYGQKKRLLSDIFKPNKSAFYCAGGNTFDDVFLAGEIEDDYGDDAQEDKGHC